jgi:hypothetical protein
MIVIVVMMIPPPMGMPLIIVDDQAAGEICGHCGQEQRKQNPLEIPAPDPPVHLHFG